MVLIPASSLQRIWTPTNLNFLSPGLYNNLTSTLLPASVTISHSIQPFDSTVKVAPDLLISSTGCTCYLHRCISSFDSLAGSEVNMQHLETFNCLKKRALDLASESKKKLRKMKVTAISIIVSTLGTVIESLEKRIGILEISKRIETI